MKQGPIGELVVEEASSHSLDFRSASLLFHTLDELV
jgi:hypothetical protein